MRRAVTSLSNSKVASCMCRSKTKSTAGTTGTRTGSGSGIRRRRFQTNPMLFSTQSRSGEKAHTSSLCTGSKSLAKKSRRATRVGFSTMAAPDPIYEHEDEHAMKQYVNANANVDYKYDEHIKQNVDDEDKKNDKSRHCHTCTCDAHEEPHIHQFSAMEEKLHVHSHAHAHSHVCHDGYLQKDLPLPPPLPDPKYSFHRRIMPSSLIQFSSPEGRDLFQKSLASGKGNAFFPLSEQFMNQSDPAYCGVTTLIMVLNAIGIDPNVRWKGGWRWYGSEQMILESCCINPERVKRAGILMEEFNSLARCQGLRVDMKRPYPLEQEPHDEHEDVHDGNVISSTENGHDNTTRRINGTKKARTRTRTRSRSSLDDFRRDIIQSVQNPPVYTNEPQMQQQDGINGNADADTREGSLMVVSFSRAALGQTGDGHFSPIAAYSEETDRCLVLDVARFKYPPYWASVEDLYESMRPEDPVTNKSRGWFNIYPPESDKNTCGSSKFKGTKAVDEAQRPADVVPLTGEITKQVCPVGDIKVKYCAVNKE